MTLKWMIMGLVFLFTLSMTIIFGSYLPRSIGLLIPIFGGLIAGYLVDGNYTDGILNGGIPVSLVGLIISGISGFTFYLVFGIIGGFIGFAIKERRLIKEILS